MRLAAMLLVCCAAPFDLVQFYPPPPQCPPYCGPGVIMPVPPPPRRPEPDYLDEFHRWGGRPVYPPSREPGLCRDTRTGRLVRC